MAFDNETLKAKGLSDEQIKEVMAEHGASITGIKEKLKIAETERDNLNEQITQRDKDIKKLQETAKGSETMETELANLKQAYADEKQKHAAELMSMQFNNALAAEVGKTNARDAEDLLRFIDTDVVKFEDGKLTGVSEQITALQESKPYLFDGEIKQGNYSPNVGAAVSANTELKTAMKSEGFNFTEFAKTQKGE